MVQSYWVVISNINKFVTSTSTRLRFPEDDADASKHVAVLTIYRIRILVRIYVVNFLVWIIKNPLLVYFSGSQKSYVVIQGGKFVLEYLVHISEDTPFT